MKKLAKLSALVLALSLSVGLTAGCNKQVVGDQYTIQLYMWDSGLGTDWMEEIIEDFNASQDTYTVLPEYTSAASAIISTLSLGTGNQYDLYFTMLNTMQYNEDFLDLSDFIKETLPGENASIKSKYYPDLLDGMYNADDTINTLSYGNCWCGILYNKTMISEDELPRTTDELATFRPRSVRRRRGSSTTTSTTTATGTTSPMSGKRSTTASTTTTTR